MKKTIKTSVRWDNKNSDPLKDLRDFKKTFNNPHYQTLTLLKSELDNLEWLLFNQNCLVPFYNYDGMRERKKEIIKKLEEVQPLFNRWMENN